MSVFDLVIKDGIVLAGHPSNPQNLIEQKMDIGVQNGRIAEIGSIDSKKAKKIFSARHLHVLPGLMDCQVHFREPGMEHKENFETGSKSALLGGITGVFEMPNTSPPTTTVEALQDKRNRAKNRFYCDYSFFVGASPSNAKHIHQLEKLAGCCGIKTFIGSSTGGLLLDSEKDLETIIKNAQRRMAFHCENEKRLIERKKWIQKGDPSSHAVWRDEKTALLATQKVVGLAEKYQKPVHILHVTTEEEIEFLSKHKHSATVEVTPQHLTLFAPECYEKHGSLAQMNPPIRDKRHYLALWKAVQNNIVDIIGSDHAPHTLEEKQKPYPESPSGMPGAQTILPLLLYHTNKKRMDLKKIVQLMALNPQKHFKMKERGRIQKNFIANFTLIDIKKTVTITKDILASRSGWSPFEGLRIQGWPSAVILHGRPAMREGAVLENPMGREIDFEKPQESLQ